MTDAQPGILLVDDDPDDVELALRALRRSGWTGRVDVRDDGATALEFLREAAELPSVVVLDLKMHRMSGFDVLEHVRADPRTRLLPVVVLTTSTEDRDVVRAYELGANSYLRKPADTREFQGVMGLLSQYWSELNERPQASR